MKRALLLVLCIVLSVSAFSGCTLLSKAKSVVRNVIGQHTSAPTATVSTEETMEAVKTDEPAETDKPERTSQPASTARPEMTATDAPAPTAAISAKSGNREDIPAGELMDFFKQAVFGSNPAGQVAYKWMDPIVVKISGDYNQQDADRLTNTFDMLNEYDGFPGFTSLEAAGADANVNMEVKFVTEADLKKEQPEWSGDNSCYVEYKYDDNYEIYHTTIYLVSSWVSDQVERDYLLTWGVFFSMGFFNDSGMYYDSIYNPDYIDEQLGSSFKGPVAADWYLVSMLYNKGVKPGMSMQQAVSVLGN